MYVQFVDTSTGAPVSDLAGYELIEQGTDLDWLDASTTDTADQIVQEQTYGDGTEEAFQIERSGNENPAASSYARNAPDRDMTNNYGYTDKSALVGLAGAIPGPIGVAAKGLNAGINLNNAGAVNAARSTLGLPSLDKGQMAGAVVGVNDYSDGYIGDVNIGEETYAVGFEALTPDRRTTLTVNEARQRDALARQGIALATPEEKAANVAQFESELPDPGAIGKFANRAIDSVNDLTRDIGSIFGWSAPEIGRVVGEATRDITPTRVAETIKGAPLGPVEREALAPVEAAVEARKSAISPRSIAQRDLNYDRNTVPSFDDAMAAKTAPASVNSRYDRAPVDYSGLKNASRNQKPNADIESLVSEAAAATLGPGWSVTATSGMGLTRDEKAGRSRSKGNHEGGHALDFTLTDPQGQKVTAYNAPDLYSAVAGAMHEKGAVGVGIYGGTRPGVAGGHMHADSTPGRNARTWGEGWDQAAYEQGRNVARAKSVPTPSFRDSEPVEYEGPAIKSTNRSITVDDALKEQANRSQRSPFSSLGPSLANPQAATAAELSNRGFGPVRTADQIRDMSFAIAGELAGETLRGVVAKDPDALTELANIVSTIENRAQSLNKQSLSDPISGVVTPSQYNSLMESEITNTTNNYGEFGPALQDAIQSYYNGEITPTAQDYTHYYNPDIANPTWGDQLQNASVVGKHRFGSLVGEYQPSEAVQAARDEYGRSIAATYAGAGFGGAVGSIRSVAGNDADVNGPVSRSNFAGSMGSARSMALGDNNFDSPSFSRDTTSSNNGSRSARSLAQADDSFDGYSGSSNSRSGADGASTGFAGRSGSARSMSRADSSYDGGSSSSSNGRSSGFAGRSGSARSVGRNDSSYDSPSTGTRSSTNRSSGFAGSSGSARSVSRGDSSYDGGGSSSKGNTNTSSKSSTNNSGGFAGRSGSARSVSRNNSSYDGGSSSPSKSSSSASTKSTSSKGNNSSASNTGKSSSSSGGYSSGFGGTNGGSGDKGEKSGGLGTW
ncbi:hypothetical protein U0C82_02640 [Fulvimarina sp. 2208YS6-2-32]|uniref:Uncharacterized protein n=1 Tax=Fulvimarina uroteuthidis TaxID=3098149 RepID=A0ABU5HY31_9HYPH|nr:hypothetical protein [Fulvimarina sp. 2208YS6-2-32]MDY8108047.1 hypothetical protein [Fulvimarina sp. 2208YS6-2-32]